MFLIVSGTDRPQSRSRQVSEIVQKLYKAEGVDTQILDLAELDFHSISGADYGKDELTGPIGEAVKTVNSAQALVMVVPEYNGSFPGILKYFIDFWDYPLSFEARPVSYVGLGGRWGGLRPVEQLQQVFGYRNAYSFPQRVFLDQVWESLKDGAIMDENANQLLRSQVREFVRYVRGLQEQGLDANSKLGR